MRYPYHCYYHKKQNECGEEEVSYTYHLTFKRKLLHQRRECKTYVKSPRDGQWYHKYIGCHPTPKEQIEINEVLEMIRQNEKYAFHLQHVFI